MPITPSYPGIYIEELPSTSHTIAAAPTSVTVFVGYTHPFKTRHFRVAVELFAFSDYEREFGGFFTSNIHDPTVAYAVYNFFLNGGSHAYVVGLETPQYFDLAHAAAGAVTAAALDLDNIVFTARDPTDTLPMQVTIGNIQPAPNNNIADITITAGTQPPETFRKVSLAAASPDFIDGRINGNSRFVTVAPNVAFPATFSPHAGTTLQVALPGNAVSTFSAADFHPVFAQDSSLDKLPIFNLLVLPGIDDPGVLSDALAFAERKQAFVIMDPPADSTADPGTANPIADFMANTAPKSANGALYFPYLKNVDAITGAGLELPPSGFVAGVYARTDANRGVWKAAGLETIVHNTTGVVDAGTMTDMRQGTLDLAGINALRTFPGIGTVVYGARTLVSANTAFEQWKYVPVRRMTLFIEQTLYRNLGWAIFEPNDEPLWIALRTTVEHFMLSLFNQGAFQGAKPSQAFSVQCDSSTTTQTDINLGIVNIIVAFAPLKPAEFVVVKIAQLAGQVQS